jgi:hypothetical protein
MAAVGHSRLFRDFHLRGPLKDPKTLFVIALLALFLMQTVKSYCLNVARFAQYASGRISAEQYWRRSFLGGYGSYGVGDFSFEADAEVAQHLKTHTGQHDYVFIWGWDPLVYFLADRRAPTRFWSKACCPG